MFFVAKTSGVLFDFFRALAGAPATEPNEIFLRGDTVAALLRRGFPVLSFPSQDQSSPATIPQPRIVGLTCAILLLLACAGRMAVSSFQPFLYFRF